MTEVEIEYCVPCGLLEPAIETQRALLTEYGQALGSVRLTTGHGGVFTVRVNGEQIFDRSEGYDVDAIKARVGERVDSPA